VARELKPLEGKPEMLQEAWAEVIERHGEKPTAKQVKAVVTEWMPPEWMGPPRSDAEIAEEAAERRKEAAKRAAETRALTPAARQAKRDAETAREALAALGGSAVSEGWVNRLAEIDPTLMLANLDNDEIERLRRGIDVQIKRLRDVRRRFGGEVE
jgi:predicted amidohydrolase